MKIICIREREREKKKDVDRTSTGSRALWHCRSPRTLRALLSLGALPQPSQIAALLDRSPLFARALLLAEPLSGADWRSESPSAEMARFFADRARYRADWSALVPLALGLAALDLPALLVVMATEWLAQVNDERFGEYGAQRSWRIAALVKARAAQIAMQRKFGIGNELKKSNR